jgi:hypothetical protein
VLLIKVQPTKAEILFQVWGTTSREQWESRTVRPKQGRQIQQVRAHLKDDNQIEVDGDFSISFLKLMERIPNPATPEGDILFTQNDLADIATRVWQSQGFLAQGSLAPIALRTNNLATVIYRHLMPMADLLTEKKWNWRVNRG